MSFLYNRINREELRKKLMEEPFKRITISFYRYVIIEDPAVIRDELFAEWNALDCFGRIYVAREGYNAQMSIPEHHYRQFLEQLYARNIFKEVPIKVAVEDDGKSFFKLTIKVKDKIVNDGLDDGTFDVTNVGKHLEAEEFHQALDDPDSIIIDMRNHYECEVGHFQNAILPDAPTFRDALPEVLEKVKDKKDKKILLYCTGGIRCEKASAYFRHHGFEDVNQLHGGIIEYARRIKTEQLDPKFIGKNFVFDERLGERISNEVISKCHQCGAPCDSHTNCGNDACHLLFIQCDNCREKYEGCCSASCQETLQLPEEERIKLKRKREKDEVYNSKQKAVLKEKFPYYQG